MHRNITTGVGSALIGATLLVSLYLVSSSAIQPGVSYEVVTPTSQLAQLSGAGSGLIAHYTFDGSSGTTASDSSGNNNTGTLTNGPTWIAGKVGSGALFFDGTNDYVTVPDSASISSLEGSNQATISFWINRGVATGVKGIASLSPFSSYRDNNFSVRTEWRYGGSGPGGGSNLDHGCSNALCPIPSGEWHHVVIIYNNPTSYIYLDGQLKSTRSGIGGALNTGITAPLLLGRYSSIYLNGALDDFRIYNRALSAAEVADLYDPPIIFAAAGSNDVSGWAWSSNIGWISFNSANPNSGGGPHKVTLEPSSDSNVKVFGGYAWSPNIGWVSFENGDVSNCPQESPTNYDVPPLGVNIPNSPSGSTRCTPRVDTDSGKVSGWARILSMKTENNGGWLHLSGENHLSGAGNGGVTFNPADGKFSGYAWESSSVGWVQFDTNVPVSTNPPQPPTSITATCTVNGGNSVTITPPANVNFQASGISGGNGNYTFSWSTGIGPAVGSSPNYSHAYPANTPSGTYSTGVIITDDEGVTSGAVPISCGTVNVATVAGGPGGLYIGRSPVTAQSDFLQIRQGTRFALRWVKPGASYVCHFEDPDDNTITPSDQGGWEALWDEAIENSQTSVSNLSTSAPIPRDTYTFGLTCTDTAATPGPPFTDTVSLRILSVTDQEF